MIGFAPFKTARWRRSFSETSAVCRSALLLGWCLLQLAWHQYIAAACCCRFILIGRHRDFVAPPGAGRAVLDAHRSHFYQRATDNGFAVWRVVGEVFVLNLALAALAIASTKMPSTAIRSRVHPRGRRGGIFAVTGFLGGILDRRRHQTLSTFVRWFAIADMDSRGRALIGGIMLAGNDDFSGLLHQ